MRAFLLAGLLLAAAAPAGATTVTVHVQGVRNTRGHVLVALCTKAEFLHPHCAWRGSVPAQVGEVTVTIDNVPPATYAGQAFHDENDNGSLDRTILGLPREAMGFSNNAPIRMGPPRFDVSAFTVGSEPCVISFKLKYY